MKAFSLSCLRLGHPDVLWRESRECDIDGVCAEPYGHLTNNYI